MEQRRENPRESCNSAGVVMGGINLTCYPIGLIPLQSRFSDEECRRGMQALREFLKAQLGKVLNQLNLSAVLKAGDTDQTGAESAHRLDMDGMFDSKGSQSHADLFVVGKCGHELFKDVCEAFDNFIR